MKHNATFPFTCTGCGAEFLPEKGGQCSDCEQLYCVSCLYFPKGQGRRGKPICGGCRDPEKQYVRASRFLPS